MSQITIPFRPEFGPKILGHIKTMTCRSKRYGHPYDWFSAFGAEFELTHVFRVPLEYVVENAYTQEGCESPGELIAIWKTIHPSKGYDPQQIVWAHCWKARG